MTASEEDQESVERVHRLFMRKLAAREPDHPWVLKERSMKWQEPRRFAGSWWLTIEEYTGNGICLRAGHVTWNDERGPYRVMFNLESEGLGLTNWPDFRVLSDAQDFIDRLMVLPADEVKALHGQHWGEIL